MSSTGPSEVIYKFLFFLLALEFTSGITICMFLSNAFFIHLITPSLILLVRSKHLSFGLFQPLGLWKVKFLVSQSELLELSYWQYLTHLTAVVHYSSTNIIKFVPKYIFQLLRDSKLIWIPQTFLVLHFQCTTMTTTSRMIETVYFVVFVP